MMIFMKNDDFGGLGEKEEGGRELEGKRGEKSDFWVKESFRKV